MNNRIGILITGAVAVVVLIALAVLVAWSLRANGSASVVDGLDRARGSSFLPRVYDEARPGYVIAELYQDVSMDVASGVYDQDGALHGRYWTHDASTQTCSLDLLLADQHGRDEIAPTATPRPPEPTATPALVLLPAIWAVEGAPLAATQVAPDRLATLVPPTPAHTPTPYPTATPVVTAATGWNHWKGRPLAIETDGVAILDLPMDVAVSAYLSVRTGADSGHNTHTELARLPLPEPRWENGSAYVALAHASGRILLESDAVDATYRAAVLHLVAAPLPDCAALRLRWQRSAAVVVRALTDQPFGDWGGRAAPPPTPSPAGIALYAALKSDLSASPQRFVPADFLGNNAPAVPATISTVAGHITIPAAPDPSLSYYIGFAVRSDLAPLSDIRQTNNSFSDFLDFDDGYQDMSGMTINIGGIDYTLYQSEHNWPPILLGGDWSLR